jgi:hypothetical protein
MIPSTEAMNIQRILLEPACGGPILKEMGS